MAEINILDVKIQNRKRSADFEKVKQLSESIKEIGLINPVTIDKDCNLIAGLHRLEAFQLLGRDKIPFTYLELSGLKAELAEIDENLIRNELHYTLRADQLKRRQIIYEELYPESRQYSSERQSKIRRGELNSLGQSESFSEDTAKKTGLSQRVIQNELQIAKTIPNELKPKLIQSDITKTEALSIVRDINKANKEIEQQVSAELIFQEKEKIEAEIKRRAFEHAERIIKEKELEKKNHYAKTAQKIKEKKIEKQSAVNNKILKERQVKSGDIYIINDKHKLYIGDSFDFEKVKQELNNNIFDCVLTDPPYGISYKSPSGSGLSQRGDYNIIQGDDKPFEPDILFKYSDNIITWGANYYSSKLPDSAGWLVWDKREGDAINNNSDCELAFTNLINSARLFHHKWNGMIKASEKNTKRIHPTQKPIKLFIWCLDICKAGENIIDPFAGSGTTLIACEETSRISHLIESDIEIAASMLNRFENDFDYKVSKYE